MPPATLYYSKMLPDKNTGIISHDADDGGLRPDTGLGSCCYI
jgi:hypothetical protein